ncbi:integral membrane protein [Nannizzia gypsea CBS 118893]|uniref:Integral membrane protein n=1 Tax=Arthroderma gypseum (strain ATCC MYA-4604 / CBS 118893) TaxID=535722 RepID=E4UT58_ARTGP|nr:integral membrane protein [Nannizzia gypsea CBS 118893]EFR01454.1 integral membrane protein [Nannizzia gypsea CBS 118893]
MPAASRIAAPIFRFGEIVFGAVVAGIIGSYLHSISRSAIRGFPEGRWIYTEVIAGVSILLGLLWFIPTSFSFMAWPMDFILSMAWFVSFGLQVNSLGSRNCGSAFNWTGFTSNNPCGRWRAAEAFSFLSACFWLVTFLIGVWFTFRKRNDAVAGDGANGNRKWYRRHAV